MKGSNKTISSDILEQKIPITTNLKKHSTMSPVLRSLKSQNTLNGRQLSLAALSFKANLSTDESDFMISQIKMNKSLESESSKIKTDQKKKVRKIVEVILGAHSRALMDKIVNEEEIILKPMESIKKQTYEEIPEKKATPKEKKNLHSNKTISLNAFELNQPNKGKKRYTWTDSSLVGLNRSKETKDQTDIKSLNNLDSIVTDPFFKSQINEIQLNPSKANEKTKTILITSPDNFEGSPNISSKSVIKGRKTNTLFPKIIQKPKRMKNYSVKPFFNVNIFEGLPYVGYEGYVKKDNNMQKIIIKDLLKILIEKCNTFKNTLTDRNRIHQVFLTTSSKNLDEFNKKLEEGIGLMFEISHIILQEFCFNPEKIGISSKPKQKLEEEMKVYQEGDALEENLKYFSDVSDFLKDSVESYMIMKRQRDREGFSDTLVNNLIKYISKCRYNIGELVEHYMIYERNFMDKKKRGDLPIFAPRKFKSKKPTFVMTPREIETKKEMEKLKEKKNEFARKLKLLNKLLQNKFKLNKLKFQTREAKVNLNQEDFEIQKALLILEDSKNMKLPIANNLKRVQLEKMKNSLNPAQILLNFSREHTNFLEFDSINHFET